MCAAAVVDVVAVTAARVGAALAIPTTFALRAAKYLRRARSHRYMIRDIVVNLACVAVGTAAL